MNTKQWQAVGVGAGLICLAACYFYFDARSYPYPRCPFNYLTGWLCPGCGSQRAISALLHAELGAALRLNLLMICSLPLIGYSAVGYVVNAFSSRKLPQRFLYKPWFAKGVLVVVVLFFIGRNLGGVGGH